MTRRKVFVLSVWICGTVTALALYAQETSPPGVSVEDFLPQEAELPPPAAYPAVSDLLEAIQRSDNRAVATVLARLESYQERLGEGPLPALAYALWNAGYSAMGVGDRGIAEQCWRLALKIDPTNPLLQLSYARYLFLQGPSHWKISGRYFIRSIHSMAARPGGAYLVLYGFTDWAALWLMFILGALGILAFVIGFKTLEHDLWEKTGLGQRTVHLARFLTFLMVGIPLFFVGVIWGGLWFFLLFLVYLPAHIRRLGLAVLVGLCLLLGVSYAGYSIYLGHHETAVPWLQDYLDQRNIPEVMHEIYRELRTDPTNEKATLAYASFFARGGRLDQAMAVYTRAIRAGLNSPAVWNNLGNLFYQQELARQSLLFYDKAEKLGTADPKLSAYIQYNKGRAYYSILEYTRGEELIDKALRAYPPLKQELGGETTVFDYYPDRSMVQDSGVRFPVSRWLGYLAKDYRLRVIFTFILLIVILRMIHWPAYEAHICERCGEAYCRKCQATGYDFPYCSACLHLFVLKDGVSPTARDAKLQRIAMFKQRSRLLNYILNLAIPGTQGLRNRGRFVGAVFLMLWAMGLTLLTGFRYVGPVWMGIEAVPILGLCGLVLLIMVYLMNTVAVILRRE